MPATLPPSNLLLSGRVLLFLPSLVAAIGLNEAIVLQQVRYYLADERQPRIWQDTRWVRASLERWQERDFPFWGLKTVQRTIESLVKQGFLRAAQPDLARRDATKWYTINFAALEPLARLVERQRHERRATTTDAAGNEDVAAPPPLPASHLLLDEPPLVIVVDLARQVGLDEALLLQQLRYWLADERRPLIREGQRWVCPRDIDFYRPLTHRSPATLARTLGALERSGLLRATSRYNQQPGDRTKWYTINFTVLDNLCKATPVPGVPDAPTRRQIDEMSTSNLHQCPDPGRQDDRRQAASPTGSNPGARPHPASTSGRGQPMEVARSLKDPETETKIERGEQQHDTAVVVAYSQDSALQELLMARGITATTARTLVRAHATRVAHQVDIFDWLREDAAADPRLTPGRLRKMIEEDWAPPPGFVPRPEREARAAAARERARAAEQEWEAAAAARQAREAAAHVQRAVLLEEFGLREEDQRAWANAISAVPGLPGFLREALFYPPSRESAVAAIIFPDSTLAARARALSSPTRKVLARRIAEQTRLPTVKLWVCDYAEVRVLLHAPVDGAVPGA